MPQGERIAKPAGWHIHAAGPFFVLESAGGAVGVGEAGPDGAVHRIDEIL